MPIDSIERGLVAQFAPFENLVLNQCLAPFLATHLVVNYARCSEHVVSEFR